ncbi:TPA: hypothetical protein NJ337_003949 [Vibrio parahaemolyticus]|nr:hypothetical protein [Vibrio parahaemolyticus]
MRSFLIALSLFVSFVASASSLSTTNISSVSEEVSQKAVDFGLKVEEVQRYEAIMNGPRGAFYRRGDSNIYYVLGAEAENDQERRRYAQLYLDQSYQYYSRLSMWMKTFDAVARERFGENPRIIDIQNPSDLSSQIHSSGFNKPLFSRLKMYVKIDDCQKCIDEVNQELNNIRNGVIGGLDLYFVDANKNDNRIRKWAKSLRLSPQLVASKVVTLNHDDFQNESNDFPVKKGVLWQE